MTLRQLLQYDKESLLGVRNLGKYSIKEITDFLISRGYSKNLAELTAGKAFTNTVASFAAMDTKSSFGKLAQQLAMGFGEDSAKKYSITELIDGSGLNEIVEAFLQEYP